MPGGNIVKRRMRVGVYADIVFRRVDGQLSADVPFGRFVAALGPRVEELVVFGRLDPTPASHPDSLGAEGIRFVPLPHYGSVTQIGSVIRTSRQAIRTFASELDHLDVVWLFGPHPVALAFAGVAVRNRTNVVLGVRQDYPSYIARRLPSPAWAWAVPVAHGLDRAFRLMSRRLPTVVVGDDLARKYRSGRAPLLVTGFSLVAPSDIVGLEAALARSWDDELHILSVGRLDPEKNSRLLPAVMGRLLEVEPRWRMTIAGDGQLAEAVEREAAARGVEHAISLVGYVPHGPDLLHLYRTSNAFLHVAWTEGIPQVLFEAQASGLPIVATDVGGVAAALAHGQGGILIPPNDAPRAAEALERLRIDEELRNRLIENGLKSASGETIDVQLDRVMEFLEESARPHGRLSLGP
jgi:glycosyltransferase involved in cell wall biosynthesis